MKLLHEEFNLLKSSINLRQNNDNNGNWKPASVWTLGRAIKRWGILKYVKPRRCLC